MVLVVEERREGTLFSGQGRNLFVGKRKARLGREDIPGKTSTPFAEGANRWFELEGTRPRHRGGSAAQVVMSPDRVVPRAEGVEIGLHCVGGHLEPIKEKRLEGSEEAFDSSVFPRRHRAASLVANPKESQDALKEARPEGTVVVGADNLRAAILGDGFKNVPEDDPCITGGKFDQGQADARAMIDNSQNTFGADALGREGDVEAPGSVVFEKVWDTVFLLAPLSDDLKVVLHDQFGDEGLAHGFPASRVLVFAVDGVEGVGDLPASLGCEEDGKPEDLISHPLGLFAVSSEGVDRGCGRLGHSFRDLRFLSGSSPEGFSGMEQETDEGVEAAQWA